MRSIIPPGRTSFSRVQSSERGPACDKVDPWRVNMSVYRMNRDQLLKFIHLYKDSECLWNVQIPSYKDRDARDQAYKHIVNEMKIIGFGPKEVAQKIKNVRTTYKQELNKIKKSETSGSSPDELYKPKVPWFDYVDTFLRKVIVVPLTSVTAMEKRKNKERITAGGKKQRKAITLDRKLDVIERYERKERTVNIVRATGIPESSLRTIRSQAEKIKECFRSGTRMTACKTTQIRAPIMVELEKRLAQWIEHQDRLKVPLSATKCELKNKRPTPMINIEIWDGKQKRKFNYHWYDKYKWLTAINGYSFWDANIPASTVPFLKGATRRYLFERKVVDRFVEVLCRLGERALRGRSGDRDGENHLRLFDEEQSVRVREQFPDAPSGEMGLPERVVQTLACIMKGRVRQELESCEFLSVLVDETLDVSCRPQISVIFRYYREGTGIVERFVGFYDVLIDKTVMGLSQVALSVLKEWDVDKKVISQTYDGSTSMTDDQVRLFVNGIWGFRAFFGESSKRNELLKELGFRLPDLGEYYYSAVSTIKGSYPELIRALDHMTDGPHAMWDANSSTTAAVLKHWLNDATIVYLVCFYTRVFFFAEHLSNTLKKEYVQDIDRCNNEIRLTIKLYEQVSKLIRLVLTLPLSAASIEAGPSALRRTKSFLKSTMSDSSLTCLSTLVIENKLLSEMTRDLVFKSTVTSLFEGGGELHRLFSGGELLLPTPLLTELLNYSSPMTSLGRREEGGSQELAGSLEAAVRRPDSISGATKDPSANVDYVKSKINNLRSAFRKELKKIKKRNKGTGSGPQDVYVPKLWYFDLLGFLRDQDIHQPSITNIDAELEGIESDIFTVASCDAASPLKAVHTSDQGLVTLKLTPRHSTRSSSHKRPGSGDA
uniref:(California timema) hypothetical protein n=1 Tax=Timema californicum TaxID=61474 RepID=A0A7R9P4V9_TIMCA|nr:unnamed protein product [Timema californicum]